MSDAPEGKTWSLPPEAAVAAAPSAHANTLLDMSSIVPSNALVLSIWPEPEPLTSIVACWTAC